MKRFLFGLGVILVAGCGGQDTQSAEPAGAYRLVALQCGDVFVPLDGIYSERITIDANGIGTVEQETTAGCLHRREIAVTQHGDQLAFVTTDSMCKDPRAAGENTCEIAFPIDERRQMVQTCGGHPLAGSFSFKDGVFSAVMRPTAGPFSCQASYVRAN